MGRLRGEGGEVGRWALGNYLAAVTAEIGLCGGGG